jgi:hypothetical protein
MPHHGVRIRETIEMASISVVFTARLLAGLDLTRVRRKVIWDPDPCTGSR